MSVEAEIVWLPFAYEAHVSAAGGGRPTQMTVSELVPARIADADGLAPDFARHVDGFGVATTWRHQAHVLSRNLRDLDDRSTVTTARLVELIDQPASARLWRDYPLYDPLDPNLATSPFASHVVTGRRGLTVAQLNRQAAAGSAMKQASGLYLRDGVIGRRVREPVLQLVLETRSASRPHRLVVTEYPDVDAVAFRLDEIETALTFLETSGDYQLHGAAKRPPDIEIFDPSPLAFSSTAHSKRALLHLAKQVDPTDATFRHERLRRPIQAMAAGDGEAIEARDAFVDLVEECGVKPPQSTSALARLLMHANALNRLRSPIRRSASSPRTLP